MTIGIVAHGPRAGLAIVRALRAIEAVGRGAVGGFVSLVAINSDGRIERAETQRGGTMGLFPNGETERAAASLMAAPTAGLMSSGPDRPEPLSQFTPAAVGVGLVSGHRMPNTIGVNGVSLNEEVLKLMQQGFDPQTAVERVVNANPEVDAGIIAVTVNGLLHAANTAHVERRGDARRAVLRSERSDVIAAVLHNSIRPHRALAILAAEVALDVMEPDDDPDGWIVFRQGARLAHGPMNAVEVDAAGTVEAIIVESQKFLKGHWSLGIGYETSVLTRAKPIAAMLYEPYMVVDDGILRTIDGQDTLSVPIRMSR
jgi:hypothetical protein